MIFTTYTLSCQADHWRSLSSSGSCSPACWRCGRNLRSHRSSSFPVGRNDSRAPIRIRHRMEAARTVRPHSARRRRWSIGPSWSESPRLWRSSRMCAASRRLLVPESVLVESPLGGDVHGMSDLVEGLVQADQVDERAMEFHRATDVDKVKAAAIFLGTQSARQLKAQKVPPRRQEPMGLFLWIAGEV